MVGLLLGLVIGLFVGAIWGYKLIMDQCISGEPMVFGGKVYRAHQED